MKLNSLLIAVFFTFFSIQESYASLFNWGVETQEIETLSESIELDNGAKVDKVGILFEQFK